MAGRLKASLQLSKLTLRDIILGEIIDIREQKPSLSENQAWWELVERLERTNCFQNFQEILDVWSFAFNSPPDILLPQLYDLHLNDLRRRAGLMD